MSSSRADPELSVRMVHSQRFSGHEMSSSSRTQLSQVSPEYTLADTLQFQSKYKITPFSHVTNLFLALPKPEANLAIGLNDQNCNKPGKPLSLRAPSIIASLLITVTLIVLIEYINKISIEAKALFFGDKAERFPESVVFCYQYLPQMIVVALGVGWAAVDLDVKRLEPYFQLSKPEGATASNSMFLHYPFEFIAFVPINAARKGCVIGDIHSIYVIHN